MRIIVSLLIYFFCVVSSNAQSTTGVTKKYEVTGPFGNRGLAVVRLNGKYGFIDKNGNEVIPLIFDDVICDFDKYYFYWNTYQTCVSVCKNKKWGYIDSLGNVVVPLLYDKVKPYLVEDSPNWVVKNGKYGCIDVNGRLVIPFEYDDMEDGFYTGLAYVKKNGKYGFIDEHNKVLIPFKYSTTRGFSLRSDLAPVSINGKYGYVNKDGREVIPLEYDFADDFARGTYADVHERNLAAVVRNNKLGFINEEGEVVIPFQYDVVWSSDTNGKKLKESSFWWGAAAVKKGKWGAIDMNGKTIVPFAYDYVEGGSSIGYMDFYKNNIGHHFDLGGNEYDFDLGGNEYASFSEGIAQIVLRLANQGFTGYQYALGQIYYYGRFGYPKDYSKAFEWLSKGALGGNERAQCYMGHLYYYGYGVEKSFKSAYDWYIKAGDKNDREAQYYLGWLYEHGQGVSVDIEEAKRWYSKSAALGDKRAKEQLAKLGDNNIPNPLPKKDLASMSWLVYEPSTKQKDFSFKIGIKSDSKIEDVSVYVNGILTRGINPVHNDGYNMTIDRTVVLNDGQNNIKVTVKNAGGTATSEKTVTYQNQDAATIDWLAFSTKTTEKQFALKVGVKSTSKIESFSVSVNGIVDRGINPVKNDGYSLTIEKMLSLSEGNNTVKVEVKNAGGVALSEKNVTFSPKKMTPIVQQKRIALVMGNANYKDIDKRLKNPVNDATDVAAKLESLGFNVIRSIDQTQQGMEAAIYDFGSKAKNYDVALFYYAGHGVGCNGSNYLIPIDATLPEESYVQYKCTNANLVLDLMEKAHCKMKIMILDACRNNPFARSWNRSTGGGGLNHMNAPKGTFIAFSTAPGDVAQDGAERNSPYTGALLQTLDVPNLSITDFFQEVLEKVALKTNDRQNPWTSNSFRGKFIFNQK